MMSSDETEERGKRMDDSSTQCARSDVGRGFETAATRVLDKKLEDKSKQQHYVC